MKLYIWENKIDGSVKMFGPNGSVPKMFDFVGETNMPLKLKVRKTLWLNLFEGSVAIYYPTKESADEAPKTGRFITTTSCEIEVEEER